MSVRALDTGMFGWPQTTAAFLVAAGGATALVDAGPGSGADRVVAGLEAAGVQELDWIVLTHLHLDHAGAAGALVRRFPGAKVALPAGAARHLADPRRLWAGVARVYGADPAELFGPIEPVDSDRLRPLADGQSVELGDGRRLRAVDTTGHARHHFAFLDEATGEVFAGDALGVRLPDSGTVEPATAPPELHVGAALSSIDRVRALGPTRLWLAHFGANDEGVAPLSVVELCEEADAALRRWDRWVRDARAGGADLAQATAEVRRRVRAAFPPGRPRSALRHVEAATSYAINVAGLFDAQDRAAATDSDR